MTAMRRRMVYIMLIVIVVGHLMSLAARREVWPFSPYTMYSWASEQTNWQTLQIVGITADEGEEIDMVAEYLPLTDLVVRHGLNRLQQDGSAESQAALTARAIAVLDWYEAAREGGRHDGPALEGIRLYRLTWQLDPWARNRQKADRQELVFEARRQQREL